MCPGFHNRNESLVANLVAQALECSANCCWMMCKIVVNKCIALFDNQIESAFDTSKSRKGFNRNLRENASMSRRGNSCQRVVYVVFS